MIKLRVVMVAPDIQINHRILQEAETLCEQGHEVILLVGWQEGLPTHERIGHVKVERLSFANTDYLLRDRIILLLQRKLIDVLNLISKLLQKLITFISLGINKLIMLCGLGFNKLINLISLGINKLITFCALGVNKFISLISASFNKLITLCALGNNKFITMCALAVNKMASRALRLSQRLRGHRLQEQILVNKIIYYDPDVVQVHHLPYLKAGIQVKKWLRVPLVYDAPKLYPEIGMLNPRDKLRLTRLEKWLLPHCNQVITVNSFMAEEMSRRYNIPLPIVIHSTLSPPAGFKRALPYDRFRQCFSIPAEHQILLYQNEISLKFGLQDLVQAMAHVPPSIHLVIIGYETELQQELIKIAWAEGLNDRIHFFKETVSSQDLLFWLASADAGIIPDQPVDLNHYYSAHSRLFEFIQAGLPIIANDLPFLRRIIVTERFGVVIPLINMESYVQAIKIMFDPELGGPGRFKTNLFEKAAKYDWRVEKIKFLDIYSRLDYSS